ncbi:hypothetical protein GCM10010151_21790 [Actinoallomurus spadix]|uniref:Uncharacterized protein n=1 Tax=Actinoallomurus spadix TaxID=79912 RepID=A0ABN0WBK3_9ACTN
MTVGRVAYGLSEPCMVRSGMTERFTGKSFGGAAACRGLTVGWNGVSDNNTKDTARRPRGERPRGRSGSGTLA